MCIAQDLDQVRSLSLGMYQKFEYSWWAANQLNHEAKVEGLKW